MTEYRRLPFRSLLPATALALCLAGLAAFAVPSAGADDPSAPPPPVAWLSYREGKAASRHQDRPLLIYFHAAWNAPSQRLDREVWPDRTLRRYVADHLVAARVDLQDMPAVARHFDVSEPPAILLLAPDGRRLVVLRGYHGPESILRVATYAGSRAYEYADYDTWLSRNLKR